MESLLSIIYCWESKHFFKNYATATWHFTAAMYFRYFSEFSGIKNDSNFFPPFFLTVVVLYTSPSCAFCQVATHIFHTLERLISSDLVNFLTIDSTQNDLPWSFTALAVPSVLYFHPRWVLFKKKNHFFNIFYLKTWAEYSGDFNKFKLIGIMAKIKISPIKILIFGLLFVKSHL